MTTTLQHQVTGMTCGHCERPGRAEVSHVPGVTGVETSAATGRLIMTSEQAGQPVGATAVIAAVDKGWLRRGQELR